MDTCSFPESESAFDALAAAGAGALGLDTVCTSTRWAVPAADAFAPTARRRVLQGDSGMAAFLEHQNPRGTVLTSFDCMWGFSSPLVGPDPERLVAEFFATVSGSPSLYAVSISGVALDSAFFDALDRRGPVGTAGAAERCVAHLDGDFDDWMSRRSSRFRRSLRSAVRRAETAGMVTQHVRPVDADTTRVAMERLLEVERTSWKTGEGSGLVGTDLGTFTVAMAERFAATGDLRIVFARLDGRDVGYVIGGRVGDRYRGFQHSFDRSLPDLSIGKVLQHENIRSLASEGVQRYDMGMHMPYKESYVDEIERSVTLIFAGRG